MTRKRGLRRARKRQSYSREFRQEAVQMVLDGHSVTSVAERHGPPSRPRNSDSSPHFAHPANRESTRHTTSKLDLSLFPLLSFVVSRGAKYRYSNGIGNDTDALRQEILVNMMISNETFEIAGGTMAEELANISKHVGGN